MSVCAICTCYKVKKKKETTRAYMLNNLKNRKLSYAGHIMRNTSGNNNRRKPGRQTRKRETKTNTGRRFNYKSGSKRYDQTKRAAER